MLDRLMAQIVERAQLSKRGRRQRLILLVVLHAFCSLQLLDAVHDQALQVLVDGVRHVVRDVVVEAVVGGVLRESAEEVGPGQVLEALLELLKSTAGDLGVQVVCDLAGEAALHWERLVKELLVEVLLLLGDENACDTAVVELRPARPANHLEEIGERKVHVPFEIRIVELGAFHDDEPCRKVHSPRQRARRDQHLNLLLHEELLDDLPVALGEACVMHAHSKLYCVLQILVLDELTDLMDLLRVHVQERLLELKNAVVIAQSHLLLISGTHRNQVQGGETRLPSRRHEYEHRMTPGVRHDRLVCWPVHRGHPWTVVLLSEALTLPILLAVLHEFRDLLHFLESRPRKVWRGLHFLR